MSRQARITAGVERRSDPRDKLLAIFDVSGELFNRHEVPRLRVPSRQCGR